MRYLVLGSLVIVIFTFAARDTMAAPRTCVRAEIEEAYVLPDGSRQPAGLLQICLDRDYSPVAGLHSVAAGGRAQGAFLSRRMKTEGGEAEAARFAFVRDASGVLVLRGYTVPRSGNVEAYWLASPRGTRADRMESSVVAAARAPGTVWLAAVLDRRG